MLRAAMLVQAVTAMSGVPKSQIPVIPVPKQLVEVSPEGRLAAPESLLQKTDGITRGRLAAQDDFNDNLVESREKEAVVPAFERETSTLQRQEQGVDVEGFAVDQLQKEQAAIAEIKSEVEDLPATNVKQEEAVDVMTEAEKKSRDQANDNDSSFKQLLDHVSHLSEGMDELKQDSQSSNQETGSLEETDRKEQRGVDAVEGEISLLQQEVDSVQSVCSKKLNELVEGSEKLSTSAFMMTETINKNTRYLKKMADKLASLDTTIVGIVDQSVKLLVDQVAIEYAKEEEAEAAKTA